MSGSLDNFISGVRSLGTLNAEIAKEAAPKIEEQSKATAAAGTDPYGTPWEPKKDGGKALVHAADHVTARAAENTIGIVLKGTDVFHNNGFAGRAPRQIIPDQNKGTPEPIAKIIRDTAARVFAKHFGGSQ